MKHAVLKLIGSAVLFGLTALGASANPATVTLNLSGMGTITGTLAGVVNVPLSGTVTLTGGMSGTECVFVNASVSGVVFTSGDISGSITSLTLAQTAAQVTTGVATLSGSGTLSDTALALVNVPFNISGTLHLGAGVDICNISSITTPVSPTPEPASLVLAGTGMLLLGFALRRRLAF